MIDLEALAREHTQQAHPKYKWQRVAHIAYKKSSFAKQVVLPKVMEILGLDAYEFEEQFPDLWKRYFNNEITLAEMEQAAIRREFGLSETTKETR